MADQYYDLPLTGQEVQNRLNNEPTQNEKIAALEEAIKAFVNSEQVQTLINTALADYSTTDETNQAITTAITNALASYYTKTAIDTLIAGYYTKTQVDTLLSPKQTAAQVAAAISSALASYSTKTETDNLLAAKQTAAQVATAISNALASYSTTSAMNSAISTAVSTLQTALENGEISVAEAVTLSAWADRYNVFTDGWTGVVRTSAGDVSIDSSKGAKILTLSPITDFYANQFRATGFNLLHNATQAGSGYYFLVPALQFGTYGTADQNNGVLFTDANGANVKPTVYFKPYTDGVPENANDGDVCSYRDSNGLRFYLCNEPGYLIVSGVDINTICAHIAWSRRYSEYVSRTASADAGTTIALATLIHTVHSYDLLLHVQGNGKVAVDSIDFGTSAATWHRRCDRIRPTWVTTAVEGTDGNVSYKHEAEISGMKAGGAVECGDLSLTVISNTISYTDSSQSATDNWVKYELATEASGSVTLTNAYNVEDWGLEMFDGVQGSAYVTCQYTQGFIDAITALLSRFDVVMRINSEAIAMLKAEVEAYKDVIASLTDGEGHVDADEGFTVGGQPLVVKGSGAPAAPVVPTFIGQRYHDQTNKKVYEAMSVTNSVSDWVLLN